MALGRYRILAKLPISLTLIWKRGRPTCEDCYAFRFLSDSRSQPRTGQAAFAPPSTTVGFPECSPAGFTGFTGSVTGYGTTEAEARVLLYAQCCHVCILDMNYFFKNKIRLVSFASGAAT